MQSNTFYNELLTDHNLHPAHKKKLEDANLVLEGVNPSCGDDIILELKEETVSSWTARSSEAAAPSPRPRWI